ncbi:methyltransferase family protein [Thermoflavifilum aggregans]|uniref:Arsenite methyltransferase n=1 Tax=Thermoflavifilum aggregans TaxID=454188 RepID=A0A2M9CRZ5_9BACT|nr:arsenite methyltransferase [Thermoflavifilum aggregans]PJJ74667.1 methyltransferase family protein [Thermoflavifilum aggregans]
MKSQPEKLKQLVREKYSSIAQQKKDQHVSSCCGSCGCSDEVTQIMNDDYSTLEGYQPEADLGLGCGLPTRFAKIQKGDVVIDLGSGAGNDCFVARHETGDTGKVIGIDFTPAMIEKARENAQKLGFENVEFILGDIEQMPVDDEIADVVISNCVLNLVPDKQKVFSEIYRVLKPGGHFSISDIVLEGELPEAIRHSAEMYAGCISGAIQKETYLEWIRQQGFQQIMIQQQKQIHIPEDILRREAGETGWQLYQQSGAGIWSITVYAEKPAQHTCGCGGCA